jgi:hypothetical protein
MSPGGDGRQDGVSDRSTVVCKVTLDQRRRSMTIETTSNAFQYRLENPEPGRTKSPFRSHNKHVVCYNNIALCYETSDIFTDTTTLKVGNFHCRTIFRKGRKSGIHKQLKIHDKCVTCYEDSDANIPAVAHAATGCGN